MTNEQIYDAKNRIKYDVGFVVYFRDNTGKENIGIVSEFQSSGTDYHHRISFTTVAGTIDLLPVKIEQIIGLVEPGTTVSYFNINREQIGIISKDYDLLNLQSKNLAYTDVICTNKSTDEKFILCTFATDKIISKPKQKIGNKLDIKSGKLDLEESLFL